MISYTATMILVSPWMIKTKIITNLVIAYSLSPLWRLMAENVPIHPRRWRSRPVFHVTNSGLKLSFMCLILAIWTLTDHYNNNNYNNNNNKSNHNNNLYLITN